MKRELVLLSESSPTRCSIPQEAACHSGLLDRILRHDSFREAREGCVRLPLESRTVARLGAFLCAEEQQNSGGRSGGGKARRTEFNFAIEAGELLELLHAAYYTETWPLHALCSRMLLAHLSAAEGLSLEGLSDHALLLLCRAARPEQLCLLEDLALVSPLLCRREWMRRPPVALPTELAGVWEEPRRCGSRNDYESLQYWLCGAPGPCVTRAVLREDTPEKYLTRLALVCCLDASVLPRLRVCEALRELVIRPAVRPPKSLRLPAEVCVRLTHLEGANGLVVLVSLCAHSPTTQLPMLSCPRRPPPCCGCRSCGCRPPSPFPAACIWISCPLRCCVSLCATRAWPRPSWALRLSLSRLFLSSRWPALASPLSAWALL